MANYYCAVRTNYFKVKDEAAFRDIVSRIITDSNTYVFDRDFNGEKYFAFGCYGAILGLKESADSIFGKSDCYDTDLVYDALQDVLEDGEVIVIEESGNEKLRYLMSCATIITKEDIKSISLQDYITDEISRLIGRDDYMFVDTD